MRRPRRKAITVAVIAVALAGVMAQGCAGARQRGFTPTQVKYINPKVFNDRGQRVTQ